MDFASLVRESVFDVIDYVCFLFSWFFPLSVLFPSYYFIGILFALLLLPSFFFGHAAQFAGSEFPNWDPTHAPYGGSVAS